MENWIYAIFLRFYMQIYFLLKKIAVQLTIDDGFGDK